MWAMGVYRGGCEEGPSVISRIRCRCRWCCSTCTRSPVSSSSSSLDGWAGLPSHPSISGISQVHQLTLICVSRGTWIVMGQMVSFQVVNWENDLDKGEWRSHSPPSTPGGLHWDYNVKGLIFDCENEAFPQYLYEGGQVRYKAACTENGDWSSVKGRTGAHFCGRGRFSLDFGNLTFINFSFT